MLASRRGCPHPAAGGTALLAPLALLSGCAPAADGAGPWLFITAAAAGIAAAAFALGRSGERQRHAAELRAARGAVRVQQRLLTGWQWETDRQHRLLAWRGPDGAAAGPCRLFDGEGAALGRQLRTRAGFAGLRVQAEQAQDGSHGWLLAGQPRHDDLGRFDGYVGTAHPTDADDARLAEATALPCVLAAGLAPQVLALDRGQGWQVLRCNAAALARWPGLQSQPVLAKALPDAPPTLALAWDSVAPGTVVQVQGWRIAAFGPLPDGGRGLLLSHEAAAAAPADSGESDNFSFAVTHDLRAPLRVVEGFTRIVKEDYGRVLDRVGNDHLDRVMGAAARMNLMIDALLTLARLSSQPLARQPVHLSQLAGYVVDDLRRGAPEREVEVTIQPGLHAVGDPTLLRLVLENLLGNAWKYSARTARAQVSLHSVPHGQGQAFVVRDNGAGFDMRSADRLFGLFQRLHSASEFPGHGVGLASVRRIVRRHGGEIWAEAEAGRGAAFFFTLAG